MNVLMLVILMICLFMFRYVYIVVVGLFISNISINIGSRALKIQEDL